MKRRLVENTEVKPRVPRSSAWIQVTVKIYDTVCPTFVSVPFVVLELRDSVPFTARGY